MDAAVAREPVTGNAVSGLAGFLASVGITDTGTRDSVEEAIQAEMTARGLSGRVVELRWGTLVLAADPQSARLLRFEEDNLLGFLQQQHPGAVTNLRVRVDRP